jgi:DNA-binding NarL/FixJ family response regulator
LLADDNGAVRREFRKILELEDDLEVVGEAKNGHEAVAMVKKLRPALVLMDVTMPLLSGLQATCQILKAFPATKVLMLSAHSDEAYVVEAVNSGAMGYLIKHTSADSVCDAIREVHKGNTFFSPSIPRRLYKRNGKGTSTSPAGRPRKTNLNGKDGVNHKDAKAQSRMLAHRH